MKKYFFVISVFYAIFLSQANYASHQLGLFDFNANNRQYNGKKGNRGHSINALIKKSLNYSIASQIELQNLYQARAAIRISLGQILPQFDPSSALAAGIDLSASIDTVLPLIGSIFPNRWYNFKATYILRKAEKYMVHAVLANRAQIIQDIYYNIQMQIWSIKILEFYDAELEELINFLENHRRKGKNKITLAAIGMLENEKAEMAYDRSFIDALSASLPQLATEVGLNPAFDWSELMVEPCDLESLKGENLTKFYDYWPQAEVESPEIKYASEAIRAARANKYASYLNFLDIAADNTINFGTFSLYKSARSQVDVCTLELRNTKMQLSNNIQNALNNYNDAVVAIPQLENAMLKLEDMRQEVEKKLNDKKSKIDMNEILWYFKYAKGQALRLVAGYFTFKTAQADLNRFTWNGPIYDVIKDYISEELPQRLKEIRRTNSLPYNLAKRLKMRHHLFNNAVQKNPEPTLLDEEESDEE